MKNKFSIFGLFFAIAMVFVMTSCGGEDDPQPTPPVKTDLQKVQEAVTGSTWELTKAEVVANGKTYVYNGDCDITVFNDLGSQKNIIATNTMDFKYTFSTSTNITSIPQCGDPTSNTSTYSITENSGKFILTYKQGSSNVSFELITPVTELATASAIKVKLLTLNGGATSSTLTYQKS